MLPKIGLSLVAVFDFFFFKEIDRLSKDMALVKEDNQLLNVEIGRMMKNLSK